MFDPFKDFDTQGYLRNLHAEKDPDLIREVEHELFRANLDDAFSYLASRREITYVDFLYVHHILFSSFYPWAGTDRRTTAPNIAIQKAATLFCHPQDCQRAVEHGLRLANNPEVMRDKPGEIMGLFAYGHPFLDGNGRTMLVVHAELCNRAGFAIAWERTKKEQYLAHLSQEIDSPGKGILNGYLRQFVTGPISKDEWQRTIHALPGLEGRHHDETEIEGDVADPTIIEKYRELEAKRGYRIV